MSENDYEEIFKLAKREEKNNKARYLELVIGLANKGHAKSQTELGSLYLCGFGLVEKNIDSALSWFLKAESSHDPDNFYSLGMLYESNFNGPNRSFEASDEKSKHYYEMAFEFYKKRALQGNVEAMYKISEMYSTGLGVDKNESEAKAWYDKYISLRNKLLTRQL